MKVKTCTHEGCENPRWSKGLCKWHMPKKPIEAKKKPIQTRSPLKKVSGKRAKELAAYSALRKSWFDAHPNCEVCNSPATDIHHKWNRENERLNDTAYWMSVCRGCHSELHLNPIWARENNYLI